MMFIKILLHAKLLRPASWASVETIKSSISVAEFSVASADNYDSRHDTCHCIRPQVKQEPGLPTGATGGLPPPPPHQELQNHQRQGGDRGDIKQEERDWGGGRGGGGGAGGGRGGNVEPGHGGGGGRGRGRGRRDNEDDWVPPQEGALKTDIPVCAIKTNVRPDEPPGFVLFWADDRDVGAPCRDVRLSEKGGALAYD